MPGISVPVLTSGRSNVEYAKKNLAIQFSIAVTCYTSRPTEMLHILSEAYD